MVSDDKDECNVLPSSELGSPPGLLGKAIIQECWQRKARSSKHLTLTGEDTGSLIFLILKSGHCIFNSNLGILMLGNHAQDEDQGTDGAGCVSSR